MHYSIRLRLLAPSTPRRSPAGERAGWAPTSLPSPVCSGSPRPPAALSTPVPALHLPATRGRPCLLSVGIPVCCLWASGEPLKDPPCYRGTSVSAPHCHTNTVRSALPNEGQKLPTTKEPAHVQPLGRLRRPH